MIPICSHIPSLHCLFYLLCVLTVQWYWTRCGLYLCCVNTEINARSSFFKAVNWRHRKVNLLTRKATLVSSIGKSDIRQITTASFNTRQIILSVYKNSPNNSSKPALIYLSNVNTFVSEQSKLSLHHCLQSQLVTLSIQQFLQVFSDVDCR